MEKKHHSIMKALPQVKIYLDEIEDIILILKEEKFSNISIETTEKKYSSDELKEIKPSEVLTTIQAYDPVYISITFNYTYGEGVRLYAGTDTALAHGVIRKVEDLLKNKHRKIFFLFTKTWFAILTLLLVQIPTQILYQKKIISVLTLSLIIAGAMILYSILMSLDSGKLMKKNIIILKKKQERASFWHRNKDQLIVGIIVAIITAILTTVITLYVTR